ncbi:MAG: response regulator [Spirochaetales bacterium]
MEKPVIMCVDDDPSVLFSLKTELRSRFASRFQYETAENAHEALELIAELVNGSVKIVLVVSDWLMPGMKGDEFLTVVRRQYPEIRAIMLTGQVDPLSSDNVLKNGLAEAIIAKPWNSKDLMDTIETICVPA